MLVTHETLYHSSCSNTTGQFICGTYWDKETPQEACSRSILKRLYRKLEGMGLETYSGSELEVLILDRKTREPAFTGTEFMAMLGHAELYELITEIEQNAMKSGIDIESMHTELDPGQLEFTTVPQTGIKSVDNCAILKQSIKEQAIRKGLEANFMSRQNLKSGVGVIHLNMSLWGRESKENIFWDKSSADKLSVFAKHWIAGLIHHAKALTALCCPTTNCYLFLHTEFSPCKAYWGFDDRSSMIRVLNEGPEKTYMENRLASGLSNPYLVMAGTLAAGMDGVVKKMACPDPHASSGAEVLPRSLGEALHCLEEDEVMVEALGKTFVEWFVMSKTSSELKDVEGITDERQLVEIQNKKYAKLL